MVGKEKAFSVEQNPKELPLASVSSITVRPRSYIACEPIFLHLNRLLWGAEGNPSGITAQPTGAQALKDRQPGNNN